MSVAAEIPPIQPGQVFDLGGKRLGSFPIPGHTPGSMAFLDRQERLMFVDAILAGVWMQLDESLPLHVFKESLENVRPAGRLRTRMYCGA